ncbi:hypothetical protein NUU61_002473 [Penicillium alfredii]|uniref:PUM-HD domain-containing protein n=1 Tax=Penicillium alfredii TaxID=1506179 RepID=A0A9W9FRJ2_9EURO|nr:uncharacterized protein NUU61_002473 [Penicillium alfredii]KAJ5105126.1 hypothetical protein NUU61_002473 [Penicillium alfredii]
MSTLNGASKLSRMSKEARFITKDGMDVRTIPFGCESAGLLHSTGHSSSSDSVEMIQHGNPQASSAEDVKSPSSKKQKLEHVKVEPLVGQPSELEKILAKLSPKAVPITNPEVDRSSGASQMTLSSTKPLPASRCVEIAEPYAQDDKTAELLRLKQELLAANSKIALQEQELAQTRVIKHTLDQALGPPSEAEFGGREITEQTISHLQNAFNASNPSFGQFQDAWNVQEDSQSDISDTLSAGAYNRARGLWPQHGQQPFSLNAHDPPFDSSYGEPQPGTGNSVTQDPSRFWGVSAVYPTVTGHGALQPHRVLSGPSASTANFFTRSSGEQLRYLQGPSPEPRRSITQGNQVGSLFPAPNTPWGGFTSGSPTDPVTKLSASPTKRPPSAFSHVGIYPIPPYHPRPVGSPLSPTATEFTTTNTNETSWTSSSGGGNAIQTYVSPLEPLNYRRLLDKNVSCDWKYIVDKIVCNNDQQASIFLQQKLKVGTTEQKYDIIEAIVNQAYPLMVNRFGNFLVQRCFEHGTPEQVVAIANAIRGNTLSLSMDPFGCHVIQKAFDCVPEEHKAVMVHELLRRIPETVIHRYACHVWQKLFELRWSGEPPQVMVKVNEALRGLWHEVALGETGSLVVQNIFENCIEDEKSRAIEHVLHWAVDYSMDQFASKIVEKCLKIGGSEFLDRYLSRVCTGRADRPRMPLIDIAGDQYGNYLIQWILINAAPHQRELVASHIRKHMVSLRGSKFGSRVAMLCCNPSHATRPGPGAGMQIGRFNQFSEDRFPASSQAGSRFNRGNQWGSNYAPFR